MTVSRGKIGLEAAGGLSRFPKAEKKGLDGPLIVRYKGLVMLSRLNTNPRGPALVEREREAEVRLRGE